MTEEYKKKGFKCDWDGKHKLTHFISNLCNERDKDLYVDYQNNNIYAPIDLYYTTVTRSDIEKQKFFAIELKERPDSSHTQVAEWIIELHKVKALKDAVKKGYNAYYAYLWGDGYFALWDINKWDLHKIGNFMIKPHTMNSEGEPKKLFEKWGVTLNTAIMQGYLN